MAVTNPGNAPHNSIELSAADRHLLETTSDEECHNAHPAAASRISPEHKVDVAAQTRSQEDTTPDPPRLSPSPNSSLKSRSKSSGSAQANLLHRVFYDTWIAELVAMVFSASCLTSLICLLVYFNDKRLDEMERTISFNAIIVVLSTSARLSLAFAVTSALGQAKWCWAARSAKPLKDLQDLDSASRGPLGAVSLFFESAALSTNGLGAAVLVLAVTIDFFSQQAVNTPLRLRGRDSTAAVFRTSRLYPTLPLITADEYTSLSRLIENALWNNPIQMEAVCPSGDCAWDKIEYVGWCSECEVTPEPSHVTGCSVTLPRRNETTEDEIELPCNITLSYHDQYVWNTHVSVSTNAASTTGYMARQGDRAMAVHAPLTFMTSIDHPNSFTVFVEDGLFLTQFVEGIFAGVLNPVRAYSAGSLEWLWDEKNYTLQARVAQVTECALTPCRKEALASVHNHTAQTSIEKTTLMTVYYPNEIGDYRNTNHSSFDEWYECVRDMNSSPPVWKHDMTAYLSSNRTQGGSPIAIDDNPNFLDEEGQTFCHHMMPSSWYTAFEPIDSRLRGNATSRETLFDNGTFLQSGPGLFLGPPSTPNGQSDLYAVIGGPEKIQTAVENITTALDVAGLRQSDEYVTGQMFETVPVLVVQWGWLALPIILEILGCVFLVLVMLRTRRLGIDLWKTSILPSAFHVLVEKKDDEPDVRTVSQMVQRSRMVKVKRDWAGSGD